MRLTSEDIWPLSGLRGAISVTIIYGHFLHYLVNTETLESCPFCLVEYLQGVTLFFLISGMTMVTVHGDSAKLAGWREKQLFWIKRFAKVAPVYYFSVLIRLPLFVYFHFNTPWRFWSNIILVFTMTQSILGPWITRYFNPEIWQVAVLAHCYLLYPYVLRLIKGLPAIFLMWLILASWIIPIALVAALGMIFEGSVLALWSHMSFYTRMPHFLAGVIAALLLDSPDIGNEISTPAWDTVADLGSICLVGTQLLLWVVEHLSPAQWIPYMLFAEFSFLPIHIFWVAAICKSRKSWTRWALTSRPLLFLGDFSFSTYCIHIPLMHWIMWFWGSEPFQQSPFGHRAYLCFPLSTALWMIPLWLVAGCGVYCFVEKPLQDYVTKLFIERFH